MVLTITRFFEALFIAIMLIILTSPHIFNLTVKGNELLNIWGLWGR